MVFLKGSCAYSVREITKGNSSGIVACGSSLVLVLMVPKWWAGRVMPINA